MGGSPFGFAHPRAHKRKASKREQDAGRNPHHQTGDLLIGKRVPDVSACAVQVHLVDGRRREHQCGPSIPVCTAVVNT